MRKHLTLILFYEVCKIYPASSEWYSLTDKPFYRLSAVSNDMLYYLSVTEPYACGQSVFNMGFDAVFFVQDRSDAALRIGRLHRVEGPRAVTVLVVHRRPHPHEGDDLGDTRKRTREAATNGLLRGLLQDGAGDNGARSRQDAARRHAKRAQAVANRNGHKGEGDLLAARAARPLGLFGRHEERGWRAILAESWPARRQRRLQRARLEGEGRHEEVDQHCGRRGHSCCSEDRSRSLVERRVSRRERATWRSRMTPVSCPSAACIMLRRALLPTAPLLGAAAAWRGQRRLAQSQPSPPPLSGKRALVTGSTSSIGLSVAEALASQGCDLVLNGFGEPAEIQSLEREFAERYGVKAVYVGADLTKPEEVRSLVTRAQEELGGVDVRVVHRRPSHAALPAVS